MENKNVFLGVELIDNCSEVSDFASLCIIVDDETYYIELNDCRLEKARPELLNKLIFIGNDEPNVFYRSGEKNITYIRCSLDEAKEYIRNILIGHFKSGCKPVFIGNINSLMFTKWFNLLKSIPEIEFIDYEPDYISLNSIDIVTKILKLTDVDILRGNIRNDDNLIVTTHLMKNLYTTLEEFISK